MSKTSSFFLTLIALGLLLFVPQSFAEEMNTSPSPKMEERKKIIRQEIKITQTQMREDLKETIKTKREEASAKMKAEREAFKTKVAELKDSRKKMIMENMDAKISMWNKTRTDLFATVLEKLTSIVDRTAERVTKMKAEGKDTSGVEAAIASARTAIASSKTAVAAQAGKTYIITVTDETTLRENSKTTIQSIQNDLKTTGETVKAAKDAVQAIFKVSPTVTVQP